MKFFPNAIMCELKFDPRCWKWPGGQVRAKVAALDIIFS